MEWFNLIYLHSSTPDPSIVQNMRRFMNIINVFDDTDDCIACINSSSKQKIVLIVSDNFCGSLLPRIENISHILSIYILSENPDKSLSYSSSQIRGVFQSIDDIYELISDDVSPMNSDILLFQPVYDNGTTINATFLFFQLLGDILLDSNETENAFQELIHFAHQEYHGNTHELAQIEDFEKSYKNTKAMSWLSRQCFLLKVKKYALHLKSIWFYCHSRCYSERFFSMKWMYYSNFVIFIRTWTPKSKKKPYLNRSVFTLEIPLNDHKSI